MLTSPILRITAAFALSFVLVTCVAAKPARGDTAPVVVTPPLPFVSPVFGDNMVLQRDVPDRIWGWTTPGATVTVTIGRKTATAVAGTDGKWLAAIGPFRAGGPYTVNIAGPQSLTLANVLMGDVWICSGQSNMEFGVGVSSTGKEAIAGANYPEIRLMRVPHIVAATPQATVAAPGNDWEMRWQVCSPDTVGANGWGGFSAVGYYFGRHLYDSLKVPIGLIQNPWSGMPAEAFVSRGTLSTLPAYKDRMDMLSDSPDQVTVTARYQVGLDKWYAANDAGSAANPSWSSPAFDDSAWGSLKVATYWEKVGIPELAAFDGILWYRTSFLAPSDWVGKDLKLSLGTIDDDDTTYVNGVKVGATSGFSAPRTYTIPGALVVAGRNVVSVRVLDTGAGGGIYGKASDIYVALKDDPTNDISLSDVPWKYKIGSELKKLPSPPPFMDMHSSSTPTVIYNAMVSPLIPLAIKGAIWYQGESNASRAYEYRDLMPALIEDWRGSFQSGQFPFFLVQLASFLKGAPEPDSTQWAELREAQLMTTQRVPKTGMAVAIDIGDPGDIHPKDKQDVGDRLALNALAIAYGQKIEYSGPIYKSMRIDSSKVILSFTHADGLTAKGDMLKGFKIAGANHVFVPASAVINGKTVVVSVMDGIPNPVAVRYAFEIYPDANLYNAAGLPASPFRTDDWPGVTINNH